MKEYALLIFLGVVAVIVIVIGIWMRLAGPGAKKAAAAKKKAEEEAYFKDQDKPDDPKGESFLEDGNLYSMREGKNKKEEFFQDDEKEKKKAGGKLESWDDY